MIYGHATFMLAVGVSLSGVAIHALQAGRCVLLSDDEGSQSMLERLAAWFAEQGMCMPFAGVLLLWGVFMLWPSAKLFISQARERFPSNRLE